MTFLSYLSDSLSLFETSYSTSESASQSENDIDDDGYIYLSDSSSASQTRISYSLTSKCKTKRTKNEGKNYTNGKTRNKKKSKNKEKDCKRKRRTKRGNGFTYTNDEYMKINEKIQELLKNHYNQAKRLKNDFDRLDVLKQFDYIWRNVLSIDEKQNFINQVMNYLNENEIEKKHKRNYRAIKQKLRKIRNPAYTTVHSQYFQRQTQNDKSDHETEADTSGAETAPELAPGQSDNKCNDNINDNINANDCSEDDDQDYNLSDPPPKKRRKLNSNNKKSNDNSNDNSNGNTDGWENSRDINSDDCNETNINSSVYDHENSDRDDHSDAPLTLALHRRVCIRYTDEEHKTIVDELMKMEKECVENDSLKYVNPQTEKMSRKDRLHQLKCMIDDNANNVVSKVSSQLNGRTKGAIRRKIQRMFDEDDSHFAF